MKKDPNIIFIEDFDYPLPQEHIASYPLPQRDSSKLLVLKDEVMIDDHFRNITSHLPNNLLLVLNNTKVIEARIFFQKESGSIIEIFCLEPFEPAEMTLAMNQTRRCLWHCLIGGAAKWKEGLLLQKNLIIDNNKLKLTARYINKENESFIIEFSWNADITFAQILAAAGAIPLPPYIKRKAVIDDAQRYQTVFAKDPGSVAAPTAALHFTQDVFDELIQKNIQHSYITLQVGAGTFKPVKAKIIAEHQMHGESFSISKKVLQQLAATEMIVAAGTTSLRTLESLYWLGVKEREGKNNKHFVLDQWEAYQLPDNLTYQQSLEILINYLDEKNEDKLECRTSLLIMPGYSFKSAKALITNFHQPRSTLLLLVAAFIGDSWKKVYKHALENNYRFLSYGDSSLLWRREI